MVQGTHAETSMFTAVRRIIVVTFPSVEVSGIKQIEGWRKKITRFFFYLILELMHIL